MTAPKLPLEFIDAINTFRKKGLDGLSSPKKRREHGY